MGNIIFLDPKGNSDQAQINAAFDQLEDSSCDTIFLNSGKFVISDQILTTNSFTLTGSPDAILTVDTSSLWSATVPLMKQASSKESTENNITISGFTIDGQADTLNSKFASSKGVKELRGDGYYNLIDLYFGNITVSNMTLKNSLGDGLIARYADVSFTNNTIENLGHDVLYAKKCYSVEEAGNKIKTMTNSGGRIANSNNIKIHDNEIYTIFGADAGGPGIQIQRDSKSTMNNIEIYNNNIHDTYGPGIWLIAYGASYTKEQACNVHIYNNKFTGCGTHPKYTWMAGITTSGFYDTLIEKNTFDGCHGAGILYDYYNSGIASKGTSGKYNTIVKNNIIKNTVKNGLGKLGYGIVNNFPGEATIQSESNCIYDNESGAYLGVSSETDYYQVQEPAFLLFECSHDELSRLQNEYPDCEFYKRLP